MASSEFSAEETRAIAGITARIWADPSLEQQYRDHPEAVLAGAGVDLHGRQAPAIPDRPREIRESALSNAGVGGTEALSFSSASSASTISCPCTAFTASCANCASAVAEGADAQMVASRSVLPGEDQVRALMQLVDDPDARRDARRMMSSWNVSVNIAPRS